SFCSTARIFCLLFFAYTTTTEIYTLSLHDALPISSIKTPLSDKTKFSCFARRKYRQRQLTAFVSSTTPGKNAFYGELPEIIRAERKHVLFSKQNASDARRRAVAIVMNEH